MTREEQTKQIQEKEQSRSQRLEEVASRFADRVTWWGRDFPKSAPPAPKADKASSSRGRLAREEAPTGGVAVQAPPPPPAPPAPMMSAEAAAADRFSDDARQREAESELDSVAVTGARIRQSELARSAPMADANAAGQGVSIQLQAWAPDSPYARRLRGAKAEDLYAL